MRLGNILDPIHSTLDSRVWDKAATPKPVLKPRHAHWIKSRVYHVLEEGGYTDIEKWLTLYFTGSLTTYQYSEDSDCDISLFVDAKVFPEWSRAEMIGLVVERLDGVTLPGTPFPLQDFVVPQGIKPHDIYKPGLRSAYSIDTGRWIVPPEHERAHDVKAEEGGFYAYALQMADKMEKLLRYEPDKAIQFWHSIHKRRQRDMRAGKGDYCLSHLTRVLTTDFEWKCLGFVKEGDELVGFDEEVEARSTDGSTRGQQRTLQPSTVTSVERKTLPSYRITTDKQVAQVIASAQHKWLVRGPKRTVVWKMTEELIAGDQIIRFGDVWGKAEDPNAAYYLAGLYDGEGHITKEGRLQLSQKGGAVLEQGCACLDRLGFGHSRTKKAEPNEVYDTAYNVQVFGGVAESMRFLYQIPTVRLRNRMDFWIGKQISPKNRWLEEDSCVATVTQIESIGEQEVVAIGTSTQTLIAEGLYSHNSQSNIIYKFLANRGLFPAISEASGEYIASTDQTLSEKHGLNKVSMAEHSGFPELDQAVDEYIQAHPELQDLREPANAWGRCQEISEGLANHLKERGFNAYATSDELGAFEYKNNQKTEDIGAGDFTYPEHSAVEVYGLYGPHNVRTVTIDLTAAQYGHTDEWPKVHGGPSEATLASAAPKVADMIWQQTVEEGGTTRNLAGELPTLRYGFAPRKDTEERVPVDDFSVQDVESFIAANMKELAKPGKYVGTWTVNGEVFIDVTEGHDDYQTAFQRAWDGHQKAMYDSLTKEEIPVRGLDYEPEDSPFTTTR